MGNLPCALLLSQRASCSASNPFCHVGLGLQDALEGSEVGSLSVRGDTRSRRGGWYLICVTDLLPVLRWPGRLTAVSCSPHRLTCSDLLIVMMGLRTTPPGMGSVSVYCEMPAQPGV